MVLLTCYDSERVPVKIHSRWFDLMMAIWAASTRKTDQRSLRNKEL